MANLAPLGGLRPVRDAFGRNYNGPGRPYYYASQATALYVGDVVIKNDNANSAAITSTSGKIMGAAGSVIGSLPICVKATAGKGNAVTGVVVGVGLDPTTTFSGPGYVPANTAAIVWVEDNPDILFELATNGADSSHTSDDIGQNCELAAGAGGSTYSGRSSMVLDQSTIGAGDATSQLKIMRVSGNSDCNDITKANCAFWVRLNNHTEVPNITSAA